MRTRASLKIASVIQPGRRWDSPPQLTSPVFLHTRYKNNGIFQVEGGSGGVSRSSWLFITCRCRRTRTHGKIVLWEADWKGGAWKIMDACAVCKSLTLAATASCIQEWGNSRHGTERALACRARLIIGSRWAVKRVDAQSPRELVGTSRPRCSMLTLLLVSWHVFHTGSFKRRRKLHSSWVS